MKKTVFPLLLSALLLLSACGGTAGASSSLAGGERLTLAATTYPVYLFATAVTEDVDGVAVRSVVNQPMSCLHDYTLTVNDMKILEGADLIAANGVGLEDFMDDALNASGAAVIDCSAGIELLPYEGHENHDHGAGEEGHYDPHIWMDPDNAAIMVQNLADALAKADPGNADAYRANATAAVSRLHRLNDEVSAALTTGKGAAGFELITFHDGFGYFARAFDLTILKAIEEEEGAEASAKEINEILALVHGHQLPAIFTEVNGSTATAEAIARESGADVASLTMIMSGDGTGLEPYCEALLQNAKTIAEALA